MTRAEQDNALNKDRATADTNNFINPSLIGLKESDTLAINELSKQLIADGRKVFRFGLGQSPFPVPNNVVESLRLYAPEKDYLPVKGLHALRVAVAEFHRRKDGIDAQPESVLVGPGSKELLFLLQLVFNGEIIIVSPCWVSYIPQALILKKHISIIHSSYENKWHLTPDLLREFVSKRKSNEFPSLLILNYPGNPDGMSYDEESLEQLAAIAKENNILILSDEIYGQIHHQGKHVSIGKYYPEGTIVSSGLSKWCGAGGWRLGTFTFPPELSWLMEKMAVVASETYTSVSAPIQYAAVSAFKGGTEIEEYLSHVRRILAMLGNECARMLNDAGVRTHYPVGGFYLFIDFTPHANLLRKSGISTSAELCRRLLDDSGIAILPGSAFNRNAEEFTARLAFVDFDGAAALSASKSIPLYEELPSDFVNQHCARVVEGIQQIADWLESLKS